MTVRLFISLYSGVFQKLTYVLLRTTGRQSRRRYAMAVLTFLFLLVFSVIYTRLHAKEGLQAE